MRYSIWIRSNIVQQSLVVSWLCGVQRIWHDFCERLNIVQQCLNMSVNEPILQYDEKHALEIIKLSNKDRQSEKIFCDGKFKCRGQNVRCTQMCWSCVGFPSVSEMRESMKMWWISKIWSRMYSSILDFIYTGCVRIADNVLDLQIMIMSK